MVDEAVSMDGPRLPHLPSPSRPSRGASADGLTEVRLDAALPCRSRRGRHHGVIADMRECANTRSRVSSLPRRWRRSPKTPLVGFADANL
jgi:hypothetical protein